MNNLDLFKILGKLFEFYKDKSTNSSKNSATNLNNATSEENQSSTNSNSESFEKTTSSPVSPFGFENLLGGLFNTNKPSPPKPENKTSENTTLSKRVHTPLQKGMLDTMNSHDQIVKRVKEKANLSSKAKT